MLCKTFLFRTNIPYLIWKSNYWIFWPTKIQIRRIQEDGLSFLDENPSTPILTAHLFHEVHCVEGPWMIYRYYIDRDSMIDLEKCRSVFCEVFLYLREPYYYLFFSANGCLSAYYHVGVARSKSLYGPYERYYEDILHIDELKYANGDNITFVGPGHGSVVHLQSEDWYVYHSWAYKQIGIYKS